MRLLPRFALAVVLPLVLLTGIAFADPTLVAGLGLRLWDDDDSDPAPSLRRERQRAERLARDDDVALRRVLAKNRVTVELIEGRLTLLQAAAWFRHLNGETGGTPVRSGDNRPEETEGEHFCRLVLGWARNELKSRPESPAREVFARLEGELAAELARGRGKVELPRGEE